MTADTTTATDGSAAGPGRGADASAVERALAAAVADGPSARTAIPSAGHAEEAGGQPGPRAGDQPWVPSSRPWLWPGSFRP